MRWTGVFVDAVAAVLGDPEPATAAIADGRYSPEEAGRSRMRAVRVSTDSGPDLAVQAGRAAVSRSRYTPAEIGLLIHADCYEQGVEFWNAASYVQHQVLGHGDALAFEIRQMSNGGMCALEVAAAYLSAAPAVNAALVTTGDRFAEPRFPRWSVDKGLAFGDAGTALVVGTRPGAFRLLATASYAEPSLEGLNRGTELHDPPADRHRPLDLLARKRTYLDTVPVEVVTARNAAGMLVAVKRALTDAGCDLGDLAAVLVPFFGSQLAVRQCLQPLGLRPADTLLEYGLDVGHLGAGDQAAGLDHLIRAGRLRDGDRLLLVGVGAGFSWTCAVLETIGGGHA